MEFNNNLNELNRIKFELFKSQDPEIGRFDIIFEVEGKLLYAHMTMLTLVSDTFNSMLDDRWKKKDEAAIMIKDYSYDNFFQFVTFLYSGQCELTETNIFSMVDMAEFYAVAIFKNYCDEFLAAMEISGENVVSNFEFAQKYSMVRFKAASLAFITNNFSNFVDAFLKLEKSVIEELVVDIKHEIKAENLFHAVYKWAENQAFIKQAADPNLNFNDHVKAEISDFLPFIRFSEMKLGFLHEFVVSKGFIFSSFNELSKILCECKLRTKIKVTNSYEQTLHGNIISDKTFRRNIELLKSLPFYSNGDDWCHWDTEFERPSTESPLKKRDDIKWYLIYNHNGKIGVKRSSLCNDKYHYLLAELTPGSTGFDTTEGCVIEID